MAPIACAASSTTGTPARLAASMIGSRSAQRPKRCTGMMALVLVVIAAAVCAGSRLKVTGSMSTKTGRAPRRATAPAVAKKEKVGVTTSSPALTSSAISASSSASVPDDTATAWRMPSISASSRSSASTSGPMMKRWLSATRVIAATSASRSGRCWASRSSRGTGIEVSLPPRLHRGARLAIGLALLHRLALVVLLLAPGEADGHLDAAVLEVDAQRHERHPALDRLADQLANLALVQQQLAAAQRLVVGVAAVAVGADVDVVEEHLAVLDPRVAVAQVDAAFADRLHLGAEQHQPRLEGLEQVIVVEGLAVFRDAGLRFLALGSLSHEHPLARGAPPAAPRRSCSPDRRSPCRRCRTRCRDRPRCARSAGRASRSPPARRRPASPESVPDRDSTR